MDGTYNYNSSDEYLTVNSSTCTTAFQNIKNKIDTGWIITDDMCGGAGSNWWEYGASDGIINSLINNENNKMKIGKKEQFKITLVETVVTEHYFEIMAESKEEALELIEKGGYGHESTVISKEVVEKI